MNRIFSETEIVKGLQFFTVFLESFTGSKIHLFLDLRRGRKLTFKDEAVAFDKKKFTTG